MVAWNAAPGYAPATQCCVTCPPLPQSYMVQADVWVGCLPISLMLDCSHHVLVCHHACAASPTRSLKTALAYTLERDQSKDAQFLTPDSPADSAIKLFNSLLLGHEVSRLQRCLCAGGWEGSSGKGCAGRSGLALADGFMGKHGDSRIRC